MSGLRKKSLDTPDERVDVEGVAADIVQLGDAAISRSVFQPGAHCALGGRIVAGDRRASQSCQAHHSGVDPVRAAACRDGRRIQLDIGQNDVFDIPPGHDGWVTGSDPMQAMYWSGVRTWIPEPETGERVLATVLFTDIVGSTEVVERIGDRAWRELLGRHNQAMRDQLDRYRGREVHTTGDGFLAVFDGPARAIRAAVGARARIREIGLETRAGIHTGEVELVGDDVRGVAVHEAAQDCCRGGKRRDPGLVDDP